MDTGDFAKIAFKDSDINIDTSLPILKSVAVHIVKTLAKDGRDKLPDPVSESNITKEDMAFALASICIGQMNQVPIVKTMMDMYLSK